MPLRLSLRVVLRKEGNANPIRIFYLYFDYVLHSDPLSVHGLCPWNGEGSRRIHCGWTLSLCHYVIMSLCDYGQRVNQRVPLSDCLVD